MVIVVGMFVWEGGGDEGQWVLCVCVWVFVHTTYFLLSLSGEALFM